MKWWAQRDLNPRPSDYESPSLTAELWAPPKVSHKLACDVDTSKPNRDSQIATALLGFRGTGAKERKNLVDAKCEWITLAASGWL